MRFCNLTPFLPVAKLVARHPPQPEMMVLVRASYRVCADGTLVALKEPDEQGSPRGDVLSDDDRELLYADDFADFKMNAEVLVVGHCYAPEQAAVTECPVQITVGHWKKLLRVVGKRHWRTTVLGRQPSEPEPFSKMALTWAHAFGGEGFPPNPAGTGLGDSALPCLEYPDEPLLASSDRPRPASFGPIHPQWPQRADKQGRQYGDDYQKTRAPFYAEDFDWSFFNAAPKDQQLDGYLRGDEPLALFNLHPDAAVIETRLPATKVRVLVKDDSGEVREVKMVLDTLLTELDERRIHLSWRGVIAVRESDLDDIQTVLVAAEPLNGPAETLAYYRQKLERFEADPAGALDKLTELVALQRRVEENAQLTPEQQTGNPISDALKRKLGDTKQELQTKVKAALEQARSAVPDSQRDTFEKQLAVHAEAADIDTPPPRRSHKPGSVPVPNLRPGMRRLLAAAADVRTQLDGLEQPDRRLEEQLPDDLPAGFQQPNRALPEERRVQLLERVAELEQAPHEPLLKELDPEYEPPLEPLSEDEPGPGADLRERDLSDRDLSGMDLRGARFDMAILHRTNFSNCNLSEASFHRAVMYKAQLNGAQLNNATLTKTNAAFAELKDASLAGAQLDEAFFEDADLSGADLTGACGQYPIFTRAKLIAANGREAKLPHADFSEAQLTNASFRSAVLTKAVFEKAQCQRLDLHEADLTAARLPQANLEKATLTAVRGTTTQWQQASLVGATLRLAVLAHADFTKTNLQRGDLYGADLRDARLYRTDLSDANMTSSNLFRADLRKAQLHRTRLVEANLYEAVLLEAAGKDTDLRDAVLTGSTLVRND